MKLFEPRSALYKVNQAVSAQKPGIVIFSLKYNIHAGVINNFVCLPV